MDDGLFLTVEEAAERLNVNPETIRRRIRRGNIKAQLLPGPRGDQYSIPLSELTTQEAQIVPVPQLPPAVLEQFTQAVSSANQELINTAVQQLITAIPQVVEAVVDSKTSELKAQNEELKNQLANMEVVNLRRAMSIDSKIDTFINETRAERRKAAEKSWWKFWD